MFEKEGNDAETRRMVSTVPERSHGSLSSDELANGNRSWHRDLWPGLAGHDPLVLPGEESKIPRSLLPRWLLLWRLWTYLARFHFGKRVARSIEPQWGHTSSSYNFPAKHLFLCLVEQMMSRLTQEEVSLPLGENLPEGLCHFHVPPLTFHPTGRCMLCVLS
jgi:hypothetical protein